MWSWVPVLLDVEAHLSSRNERSAGRDNIMRWTPRRAGVHNKDISESYLRGRGVVASLQPGMHEPLGHLSTRLLPAVGTTHPGTPAASCLQTLQ